MFKTRGEALVRIIARKTFEKIRQAVSNRTRLSSMGIYS